MLKMINMLLIKEKNYNNLKAPPNLVYFTAFIAVPLGSLINRRKDLNKFLFEIYFSDY